MDRIWLVTWSCILGIVFVGCYTSDIVKPIGEGKERVTSDRIFFVVTNDSARYDFQEAPTVVGDVVEGEINVRVQEGTMKQKVSIPLSDVAYVCVKDPRIPTVTIIGSVVFGIYLLIVIIYSPIYN